MIIGIETDIVEIERIKKVIERTPSFLNGAFTSEELIYINSKMNRYEVAAGFFQLRKPLVKR